MSMDINLDYWIFIYFLCGSLSSFVGGLLGIGGGIILVPTLTYLFLWQGYVGQEMYVIVLATAMACIVPTSIISMLNHHQHGTIDWAIVKRLSPGLIGGSILMAQMLDIIPVQVLISVFIAVLGWILLTMVRQRTMPSSPTVDLDYRIYIAGALIGPVATAASLSGGLLVTPYLVSRGKSIREAISTSSAIGVPVSIFASMGHLINGWQVNLDQTGVIGYVHIPAFLGITMGSLWATRYGVKLSHHIPVKTLRIVFLGFVTVIALSMLFRI